MAEKRTFKMHSKLLFDTIFRQAGTLSKAVLEGVMNSVDAKATKCEITLAEQSVLIRDDGTGFQSREEIEQNFEVFGQPHTEREQKTYGRFRMGRGQLLAYGVNTWTTNTFQMKVDAKNDGLDYELESLKVASPGCQVQIALYDTLSASQQRHVEEELEEWCKWTPIPVSINGRVISKNAALADHWSEETDDAWLDLNERSDLRLYNQGIHVQSFPKHRYGVGGDVVTKHALEVNFARNEIMSSCPVWKRLLPLIDQRASERASRNPALDDAGRQALLKKFGAGTLPENLAQSSQIITAVTGRHYSIPRVADYRYGYRISFAELGSPLGDRLHRQQAAFIVATKVLTDARISRDEFLEKLAEANPQATARQYVPFEQLTASLNTTFTLLEDKQLTPRERYWLALLNSGNRILSAGVALVHAKIDARDDVPLSPRMLSESYREAAKVERRLVLGIGPAHCWTDGASYIAISREFMASASLDLAGFVSMSLLLIHEYCHLVPDVAAHDHDQAFYESFHDLCRESQGRYVDRLLQKAPLVAQTIGRKLSRGELGSQDKARRAQDASAGLIRQIHASTK